MRSGDSAPAEDHAFFAEVTEAKGEGEGEGEGEKK